jgi:hypothetical protein
MPSHCHVFCHRGLPDIDPKRELLHFARGPDRHRELATPLQHDQAPRLNQIQATSTRGVRACIRGVAGCATPPGSAGLTFHLDHSVGANHWTRLTAKIQLHRWRVPPVENFRANQVHQEISRAAISSLHHERREKQPVTAQVPGREWQTRRAAALNSL